MSWVLILSIFWGVLAVPAAFPAIMSAMVFDAPGSGASVITKLFAFSLAFLPVTLLVACIGGLACSLGDPSPARYGTGTIFVSLPLLNGALLVLAYILLQVVQGGQFK